MTLTAYIVDTDTGTTIATFGMEHEPEEYRPERWMLVRQYTMPAVGPGGHPWIDWAGAIVLLGTTFSILGRAL